MGWLDRNPPDLLQKYFFATDIHGLPLCWLCQRGAASLVSEKIRARKTQGDLEVRLMQESLCLLS